MERSIASGECYTTWNPASRVNRVGVVPVSLSHWMGEGRPALERLGDGGGDGVSTYRLPITNEQFGRFPEGSRKPTVVYGRVQKAVQGERPRAESSPPTTSVPKMKVPCPMGMLTKQVQFWMLAGVEFAKLPSATSL